MTSTTALHFGPEWMRAKPARPAAGGTDGSPASGLLPPAASYASSLAARADGGQGLRYTRDELIQIWKDGSRGELSPEVERWDGVVGDDPHDPAGLHDMDEHEKKLYAQSLNSDGHLRRRQSQDALALTMPGTSPGSGKFHGPSSPLRERPFGGLVGRRRDSDAAQGGYMPRRLSQSGGINGPLSPSLASPRPRMDGWLQRKKTGLDGNKPDEAPREGDPADNPTDGGNGHTNSKPDERQGQQQAPRANAQDPGLGAPEPAPQDVGQARDASNGYGNPANGAPAPPPVVQAPPLPPPETINWSYKDPTGTIQGPFNGRLMQDWYDKGFFPAELTMKRTEIDADWRLVREWEVLGGKRFFLAQLPVQEPAPPGLGLGIGASPLLPSAVAQPQPVAARPSPSPQAKFATTSEAFQRAPQPSRTSTLDTAGSESTNSSYNAAYGQADSGFGAVRAPRFNAANDATAPVPIGGYSGRTWDQNGTFQENGSYGTNNFNGVASSSPSTSFSQSSFAAAPATTPYGAIGTAPGQRGYARAFGSEGAGLPLGSTALNQDASALGLGRPSVLPSGARSRGTSYASDTAWQTADASPFVQQPRLGGQPVDPAIVSATRGADFAAPGRPTQTRQQSQPASWYYPSQPQEDSAWGTAPQSVTEHPLVQEPVAIERGVPTPPLLEPTPPPAATSAPVDIPKRGKAASGPAPIAKPAAPLPLAQQSPAPTFAQPVKGAWAKPAEEVPKAKPTLRDIQEAEARQAEAARKAAAAPKPVSAPRTNSADVQTITTSWGLPTSKAGQAPPRPATEVSPLTPAGGVAPSTPTPVAGVWTNAAKPAAVAKKSVKEIQEEEERRKRVAAKDSEIIAGAKRGYASTATKAPTPSVWTTVGASGKTNPIVAAARPAAAAVAASPVPAAARVANGGASRPPTQPAHAKQPSVSKAAEEFVAPSADFMKWLRDALKDMSDVNLDEFMRLLLTFPINPQDPGVVETIAEMVYMYSSTMDGRRFAAEFCTRRKADAGAKKGPMITNPAAKQTMVAEVVKSQPKPAPVQSEWKAASGKKKRGGKQ